TRNVPATAARRVAVRHAAGEAPETGEAFSLGQFGAAGLAFGHRSSQSIEGCEWPLVLAAGGGDDRLRYGADLAVMAALEVACQCLHRTHHATDDEPCRHREQHGQRRICED